MHSVYKVLVPEAVLFEYRCKHPFIDQLTIARIHLRKAQLERGLNFIQTYASEFIQQYEWYLQDNAKKTNDNFNDIEL